MDRWSGRNRPSLQAAFDTGFVARYRSKPRVRESPSGSLGKIATHAVVEMMDERSLVA
jgi:hypothetical protein